MTLPLEYFTRFFPLPFYRSFWDVILVKLALRLFICSDETGLSFANQSKTFSPNSPLLSLKQGGANAVGDGSNDSGGGDARGSCDSGCNGSDG